MRKVSTLIGLTLFALAGTARAQEAAPATEPGAPEAAAAPAAEAAPAPVAAASQAKVAVGVNLLGMALGKAEASAGGETFSSDAAFAYGVGITAGFIVIPGLTVGIAPQAVLNVKGKDATSDAAKEYDLMARVAYALPVADKISVYAEVLPGYSIVAMPSSVSSSNAKGLVLAGGLGATFDITDQAFVGLGVGYQMGFQKMSVAGTDVDFKTKYLRIALGGGVKF